jgi:hypothetical protein
VSKRDDLQHLIALLLASPAAHEMARTHRWSDERDREHELIVAFLVQVVTAPERDVRAIADRLRYLGLLDLEEWNDTAGPPPSADGSVVSGRTLDVLADSGIAPGQARQAVAVLQELAAALKQNFDGKVQRCLRDIGEKILATQMEALSLPSLSERQAREALVYWLQNVANMPISLNHETSSVRLKLE